MESVALVWMCGTLLKLWSKNRKGKDGELGLGVRVMVGSAVWKRDVGVRASSCGGLRISL